MFDAVIYAELDKEEAKPLIEKYRKEGAAALPPPSKRFRGDRFGKFFFFFLLSVVKFDFCLIL